MTLLGEVCDTKAEGKGEGRAFYAEARAHDKEKMA